MAANGNTGNSTGTTGTATSASQAQSQAASTNAANSNTAHGESNAKGDASNGNSASSNQANGEANAKGDAAKGNAAKGTNSAGLGVNKGSKTGMFGVPAYAVTNNESESESNNADAAENNTNTGENSNNNNSSFNSFTKAIANSFQNAFVSLGMNLSSEMSPAEARSQLSSDDVAAGDKAYTEARARGLSEAKAQRAAVKAVVLNTDVNNKNRAYATAKFSFRGKNTGPTYNPATTAMSNVNPTIAAGSSNVGPSAPAAPAASTNTEGPAAGSTSTGSVAPSVSNAANTGITNRGSTVTSGGGTSVTDSGTGGSISSNITSPSRDASSIGLGVYNTDRANYDQDNWNRGMESESSSLVSDEECKAFAKRAFLENSEPFKKVRVTIIKKC